VPRAFTAAERETIEARLAQAGLEEFGRHGLRRTNVAALARAAGIAKGSFYLFFPSKEALLLSLLAAERARTRAKLGAIVGDAALPPRDRIERFLRLSFESFAESPLLAQLRDPEEAEALARTLPAGALDHELSAQDDYFVEVLQEWQDAGELTPFESEAIVGLAHAIRAVGLEHGAIGDARFPRTLDLLVGALADYLAW
jgi:AcrR family transcriptional regulator